MKKFPARELMVDFARNGVLKPSEVIKIVDLCKKLSINNIGVYLETPPSPSFIKPSADWESLSQEEWKEIVSHAAKKNILIYPYIETLAHLEKLLSLDDYQKFQHPLSDSTIDTANEDVYIELIEPLIVYTAESFRVKGKKLTINIGCDEAVAIKDGEHFVKHINKVAAICKMHLLECSAWADGAMKLSKELIKQIDKSVKFTYWKYPSHNEEQIEEEIRNAKRSGLNVTAAAASTFSHNQFYPLYNFAAANIKAIAEAASRNDLDHIILTQWFDDNAEAPFRASLPSLVYFSSVVTKVLDEKKVMAKFHKIAANPWHIYQLLSSVNFQDQEMTFDKAQDFVDPAPNPIKFLVFENPKTIPFTSKSDTKFNGRFNTLFHQLKQLRSEINEENLDLYKYTLALTNYLRIKSDLGKKVRAAYQEYLQTRNPEQLNAVINEINTTKKRLKILQYAHKRMWMLEKKPKGWKDIQIRYEVIREQLTDLYNNLEQAKMNGEKVDYLLRDPNDTISQFPFGSRKYKDIAPH